MTHPNFVVLSTALAVALSCVACNPSDPPAAVAPPASDTADASANIAGADASEEVVFEPAYPEEVSREGLTTEDLAQQAPHHPHGDGEPHEHGADDYAHDPVDDSDEDADEENHGQEH